MTYKLNSHDEEVDPVEESRRLHIEAVIEDDHDCGLIGGPDGHCNHFSHQQI